MGARGVRRRELESSREQEWWSRAGPLSGRPGQGLARRAFSAPSSASCAVPCSGGTPYSLRSACCSFVCEGGRTCDTVAGCTDRAVRHTLIDTRVLLIKHNNNSFQGRPVDRCAVVFNNNNEAATAVRRTGSQQYVFTRFLLCGFTRPSAVRCIPIFKKP